MIDECCPPHNPIGVECHLLTAFDHPLDLLFDFLRRELRYHDFPRDRVFGYDVWYDEPCVTYEAKCNRR